jgi:CRISPR type III-B/RAMP module RAMP protein Cmr1
MKTETFQFELLTPCFCGGAEPDKQAEIRAPSIRGQLRWWFRTLGGFKSLAPMPVREQEAMIFGSTAGGDGRASKLVVRVRQTVPSTDVVDDEKMGARPGSERGYLLFPLRPEKKGKPEERRRDRGVHNRQMERSGSMPSFSLDLQWRGQGVLWPDIRSLVGVFGHLGALGFRSRRCMGAMALKSPSIRLVDVMPFFSHSSACRLTFLDAEGPDDAIRKLAQWLMSWRAHGQSGNNDKAQQAPGYRYALSDHDVALGKTHSPGFRAPLGMPLLTKYGNWSPERPERPNGTRGRFASPVLLRPYRDAQGKWHALVIFVDAHKWPEGKKVYLNGKPVAVSLDLYEEMKRDRNLHDFLPAT